MGVVRLVLGFVVRVYVIVSGVHLMYMIPCYRSASGLDWLCFAFYVFTAMLYKIYKEKENI